MDARVEPSQAPPPPLVSPDGRFYLDDGRWVPLPKQPTDARAIARGVADGIGELVAKLILAVVLLPAVVFGAVRLVLLVVPESVAGVAAVATIVVLLGIFWTLLRSRD